MTPKSTPGLNFGPRYRPPKIEKQKGGPSSFFGLKIRLIK